MKKNRNPSPRKIAAAIASYATAPSHERKQHDTVALITKTFLDDLGRISQPYRVQSMLDRLVVRGDATDVMRQAGYEFNKSYRMAALSDIRVSDFEREVRSQGAAMSGGQLAARRRRDAALDALGRRPGLETPASLCAWFVLGEELTLRDWAIREGWNDRPLSEHAAKGILLGTLSALAGHFRL